MTAPKITVLLPVYNAERYLQQTLESVFSQTFDDFELLVIDDGSSDGSAKILAKAAQNDNRCRVITQDNAGLIATLNRGLEEARSDWVARIDADDLMHSDRLRIQYEFAMANPQFKIVGTKFLDFYDSGVDTVLQALKMPVDATEQKGPASSLQVSRQRLLEGNLIGHPSVLYFAPVIQEVGGYRQACLHAEDYDCWLRVQERENIAVLPMCLTYRRVHTDNISIRHAARQSLSANLAQKAAELRDQSETDPLGNVALSKEQIIELAVQLKVRARPAARYFAEQLNIYNGEDKASYQKLICSSWLKQWSLQTHLLLKYWCRIQIRGSAKQQLRLINK